MMRRFATWVFLGLALSLVVAACTEQGPQAGDGVSVLYFVDFAVGTDAARAALESLEAQRARFDVTYVGPFAEAADVDLTGFLAALGEEPDLVIVFNQSWLLADDMVDALVSWIEDGGTAVVADSSWQVDVHAALEATPVSFNHASVTFDDARLGAGVTSPMVLTNPGWGAISTGYATTAGVVAARHDTGDPAVVYGNGGRTAAVGLLNDVIANPNHGAAFFRNLFDLMLQGTAVP